eukprot:TRINITY_DN2177_c0_g1_i1.p1 TRINITY_DN2177_c0_g1~~TRINITY_DN2177_c0_g1_i1.p1  ORF type:complete len:161 (+),score=57.63 TRINITY_DN2177_c0_g1_i1:119-601(+)
MGCSCVKADAVEDPKAKQAKRDYDYARRLQEEEDRREGGGAAQASQPPPRKQDWSSAGTGQALGGGADTTADGAEARRQRALEAAEKRQNQVKGISEDKVVEMREKQLKAEYLGKISEFYNSRKLEMPMGLNAGSAEQLKRHWDALKKNGPSAADAVLNQ